MRPSRRSIAVLPGALGFLGLVTGLGVISLFACWFLVALCMPGGTFVRRGVYAVVTLFALNAAVLTLLATLHARCSPDLTVALYLFAFSGVVLLRGFNRVPVLDRGDVLSTGLALLTAALLLPPLIHASPGQAMALISQTTDGGNHTQLVLATQREGGYLTYRSLPGLRPGMETYPGAWSGNIWMLGRVLWGRTLTPIEVVRLLGFAGIASYGLLTLLLARVALALRTAIGPTSRAHELLTLALVAMTTTLGFGLFLLNLTSYTQMAALIAILATVLLTSDRASTSQAAMLTVAAIIMVSQTWYLLLPIVAAPTLVATTRFRPSRRVALLCVAFTFPLAIFPVVNGPGIGHVQSSGPEMLPVLVGILGLLGATGVAVLELLRHRPQHDTQRLAMAGAVVASLLLVLVLVVTQEPGVTGVSYYTAKVLLIMLLLGATAGAATGRLSHKRPLASLVVIGLACSVWSTRHAALPPRSAHTKGHLEAKELDAVFARHPRGLDPATDVWIADGCDRVGDLVATKWIYDLYLTWNESRAAALQSYTDDPHKTVDAIETRAADPNVKAVEVVVNRDCQPASIASLAMLSKVKVIHVS